MSLTFELALSFGLAFVTMLVFAYLFITYLSCFVVAKRHKLRTNVALSMTLMTFSILSIYMFTVVNTYTVIATGSGIPNPYFTAIKLTVRTMVLIGGIALTALLATLGEPQDLDKDIEGH